MLSSDCDTFCLEHVEHALGRARDEVGEGVAFLEQVASVQDVEAVDVLWCSRTTKNIQT